MRIRGTKASPTAPAEPPAQLFPRAWGTPRARSDSRTTCGGGPRSTAPIIRVSGGSSRQSGQIWTHANVVLWAHGGAARGEGDAGERGEAGHRFSVCGLGDLCVLFRLSASCSVLVPESGPGGERTGRSANAWEAATNSGHGASVSSWFCPPYEPCSQVNLLSNLARSVTPGSS